MSEIYTRPESVRWKQARRSAFVQEVLAAFTQRPAHLLSFEHVQEKLQLNNVNYLDIQDIPLDQIVGSVGRYSDFTRAFFPRQDHLQARWQSIEQLLSSGRNLPPIEVYKVGQVYFVRDGNHRVSVARQRQMLTIRALVWEYQTEVPLDPADLDIDDLLCRTAHTAFLDRTHLDRLCPDVQIRLTQPDGYEDLLHEIETYQRIFATVDGRDIPFDEAVTLWCEIRYIPIIEIIRQRYVLQEFPGRTETDLYLWLCQNLQELESRYEDGMLMERAADDLGRQFGEGTFSARRIRGTAKYLARSVVGQAADWWRAVRRKLGR
jgi:hypothetical protein